VERLQARLRESRALRRRAQEARARARATRDQILRGRSQREARYDPGLARLLARLDAMPVIEQARGIIMARQECGPEEAFDLLRQASQRANVKVHVLAAQMVEQTAASGDGASVTPISMAGVGRGTCARCRGHGQPPDDAGEGTSGLAPGSVLRWPAERPAGLYRIHSVLPGSGEAPAPGPAGPRSAG
jgi:hypothetical protein